MNYGCLFTNRLLSTIGSLLGSLPINTRIHRTSPMEFSDLVVHLDQGDAKTKPPFNS